MSRCFFWRSVAGAFALSLFPLAANAAEEEGQAWLLTNARLSLGKDFSAVIEGYARFADDFQRLSITQARASLYYQPSARVTVGAGYGHVWFIRENASDDDENRIWQELTWRPETIGGLSLRTRLEERFLSSGDDTGLRLREQVKLKRPILSGASAYVYGSGEAIFSLTDTDWGARAGFEQLRLSAGGGFRVNDHARIETGYLNQYLPRKGAEDHMNHVVLMILSFEP